MLLSNEQPSSKAAIGGEEAVRNQVQTPQMAPFNSVTPKLSALKNLLTTKDHPDQNNLFSPAPPSYPPPPQAANYSAYDANSSQKIQ